MTMVAALMLLSLRLFATINICQCMSIAVKAAPPPPPFRVDHKTSHRTVVVNMNGYEPDMVCVWINGQLYVSLE